MCNDHDPSIELAHRVPADDAFTISRESMAKAHYEARNKIDSLLRDNVRCNEIISQFELALIKIRKEKNKWKSRCLEAENNLKQTIENSSPNLCNVSCDNISFVSTQSSEREKKLSENKQFSIGSLNLEEIITKNHSPSPTPKRGIHFTESIRSLIWKKDMNKNEQSVRKKELDKNEKYSVEIRHLEDIALQISTRDKVIELLERTLNENVKFTRKMENELNSKIDELKAYHAQKENKLNEQVGSLREQLEGTTSGEWSQYFYDF